MANLAAPDKRNNAPQRETEALDLYSPDTVTPRFPGPYVLRCRPNSRGNGVVIEYNPVQLRKHGQS
jgi:hypothetical protein